MKERNERLKNHKLEKKIGKVDYNLKEELSKNVSSESEEMWIKKSELKKIEELLTRESLKMKEREDTQDLLNKKVENLTYEISKIKDDIEKNKKKYDNAKKSESRTINLVKSKKPDFDIVEGSALDLEIKLQQEQVRNQYLLNAITILCNQNIDLRNALNNPLQERGIVIPNRPISEKSDSLSVKSRDSNRSMN